MNFKSPDPCWLGSASVLILLLVIFVDLHGLSAACSPDPRR
jgi:hypothetical protein